MWLLQYLYGAWVNYIHGVLFQVCCRPRMCRIRPRWRWRWRWRWRSRAHNTARPQKLGMFHLKDLESTGGSVKDLTVIVTGPTA
jgi:hypothetical protein